MRVEGGNSHSQTEFSNGILQEMSQFQVSGSTVNRRFHQLLGNGRPGQVVGEMAIFRQLGDFNCRSTTRDE